MRRRTWIKRIRTLSLALLLASVGLWVVSEYLWIAVSVPYATVECNEGVALLCYFEPQTAFQGDHGVSIIPIESEGLEFRGLSIFSLDFSDGLLPHFFSVTIPFWLTGSLALGAFVPCTVFMRRMNRFPGMCPTCGYDASSCTEGRCSECGEALAAIQ